MSNVLDLGRSGEEGTLFALALRPILKIFQTRVVKSLKRCQLFAGLDFGRSGGEGTIYLAPRPSEYILIC